MTTSPDSATATAFLALNSGKHTATIEGELYTLTDKEHGELIWRGYTWEPSFTNSLEMETKCAKRALDWFTRSEAARLG